jgi:alpha-galactosidase
VNENKLKGGLNKLVKRIATLQNHRQESIQFGLWVEPEHVNPDSELYEAHPEWTLHAGADGKAYPRVKQRNQYILDLSLVEVQDYLIEAMSNILSLADISYIKWDCNKAIEQLATPSVGHAYILGLYRVIDALTTRFPDVLWEGCASGGGRFDPGLLQYWPGSWTSDCTDPVERLHIQTGTSLVYPPSSMSGHVSASPNHQTGRETPLEFRAHVAMLCGSFGLELDPSSFSDVEREQIPELIRLSERISPYIVQGDLYRLARPEQANWPAFLYVNPTGSGVLLAYQVYNKINTSVPAIRLYGLDRDARYVIDEQEYAGDTLMSSGLRLPWKGDYQSRVLFLDRVQK